MFCAPPRAMRREPDGVLRLTADQHRLIRAELEKNFKNKLLIALRRAARPSHRRRLCGQPARAIPRQVIAMVEEDRLVRCPRGPDHSWQALVAPTVRTNASCPFCGNHRVSVTNSLAKLFPRIAREWNPTRNRGAPPATVIATSSQPVWWRCSLGHAWRALIRSRTFGKKACPVCADAVSESVRRAASAYD
jgi:hypothetical protein